QWVSIANAAGTHRLDDPADFVRIEVETALSHKQKIVIPVLVDNASLPSAAQLPESLRDLPYRNAVHMRPDPDFNRDFEELLTQIKGHLNLAPARNRWIIGAAAALLIVAIALVLLFSRARASGIGAPSTGTPVSSTIQPVAADEYMVL